MIDYIVTSNKILSRLATYTLHKDKNCTRFRLSARSLRKLTGLPYISDEVFNNLNLAVGKAGWSMIRIEDHFGFIASNTISSWPRIAMSDDESEGE